MDNAVDEQLIQALMRLQKTNMSAYCSDVEMNALFLMKSIANNSADSDNNVYMVDLQDQLHISKAAISQTANNLEKKGYLTREINKNNRRKLTVTLTPHGRDFLRKAEGAFDRAVADFLARLGEPDARETVRLFNRFADIAEELSAEKTR